MKDDTVKLPLRPEGDATERPLSIAIVAMGGQGGGVLTNWIVELAECQGWIAQSTSVPGVAQRTGATIYYVEMMKPGRHGQKPVLAQVPTPGDVDVVIAAEYMEAGRSILRGIVTPDRTTLIASDHRSLSTIEKMPPGEGIADSGAVSDAIGIVAKRRIVFDMNRMAVENGSVISSALFGSLSASGALPFSREDYHAVIQKSGKGVEASICTFDAAAAQVEAGEKGEASGPLKQSDTTRAALPRSLANPRANALLLSLHTELPAEAHAMAYLGLKKVVDFQDAAYGEEYLETLAAIAEKDRAAGGDMRAFTFTNTAAKYLANAMAYDDIFRVADLKTRAERRRRIEDDLKLSEGQILGTTEFMHPRLEELSSALPAGLAGWLRSKRGLYAWLDRRIDKGRRVRTYSLPGFSMLYCLAGLKRLRRRSLRHAEESDHRTRWLTEATDALQSNYDLAVSILNVRRLIKGYSDTHARGHSKFDKVMRTIRSISQRDDAAMWADRLLRSALKDGEGDDLDGTIKTIQSFSEKPASL